jgi:hypothetical protein
MRQTEPPEPRWATTAEIEVEGRERCEESDERSEPYERPWKPYFRSSARARESAEEAPVRI